MGHPNFWARVNKLEKALAKRESNFQLQQPKFSSLEEFANSCKIRSGSQMVNFKPYPYQLLLFDLIETHQSVDVIKTRQLGLTQGLVLDFLYLASLNPAYVAAVFSLSQPDSSQVSLRCRQMLDSSGLKASNDNVGFLQLNGGGSIHFKNSSERGSRGLDSISHLLLDEAAFQANPGAILAASAPSLSMVDNPCVVCCSTPNGKSGWFYDRLADFNPNIESLCQEVATGHRYTIQPGVYHKSKGERCLLVVHWLAHPLYREMEKNRPGGYLAYRQQQAGIDEVTLHQEHNLCFAASAQAVFLVSDVMAGIKPIPGHKPKSYLMGVDPNFGGSDYCAAVVLGDFGGRFSVIDWYYKRQKTSQENMFAITQLINEYQIQRVIVETNGGGTVYADHFGTLDNVVVTGIHTTRESKLRQIERLNVELQKGNLSYSDKCPLIGDRLRITQSAREKLDDKDFLPYPDLTSRFEELVRLAEIGKQFEEGKLVNEVVKVVEKIVEIPIKDSAEVDGKTSLKAQNFTHLSNAELLGSHTPYSASEKLKRAVEAIKTYNEGQPEKKNKWAINTTVLKQLTNCRTQAIEKFLKSDEGRLLVKDYNSRFEFGYHQNRGKGKITDVLKLA